MQNVYLLQHLGIYFLILTPLTDLNTRQDVAKPNTGYSQAVGVRLGEDASLTTTSSRGRSFRRFFFFLIHSFLSDHALHSCYISYIVMFYCHKCLFRLCPLPDHILHHLCSVLSYCRIDSLFPREPLMFHLI